jgi:hypothetical protein
MKMGVFASCCGCDIVTYTSNTKIFTLEPEFDSFRDIDSHKSVKCADNFLTGLLINGNQYDSLAILLSNQRSRYYFTRFLREFFDDMNFELSSWNVSLYDATTHLVSTHHL